MTPVFTIKFGRSEVTILLKEEEDYLLVKQIIEIVEKRQGRVMTPPLEPNDSKSTTP